MRRWRTLVSLGILALGGVAYQFVPAERMPPIAGVVRSTEIRIAPEIGGHLAPFRVRSGDVVHPGDALVELTNPELVAAVYEARAVVGEAQAARDRVYAGVRQEQTDMLAREVDKAEANLQLATQHYGRIETLASHGNASRQDLDKATADLSNAQAALAMARQRYGEATAGPIKEELAAADAALSEAKAAAEILQRRLEKTVLVSPCDCIVRVIVAEVGEAVRPGQPVLTLEPAHERWFAFNVREDRLGALAIGATLGLKVGPDQTIAGRVTEIRPLGDFATWRAARAVGDHDLNTFRVRVDPTADVSNLEAGMTVWLQEP